MGFVLNCLVVRPASSMAVNKPIIVTTRAATFKGKGIVIIGVFEDKKFDVMMRPATILPQARRLIGLITDKLFSLIGDNARNRGVPIVTKKTTRRL